MFKDRLLSVLHEDATVHQKKRKYTSMYPITLGAFMNALNYSSDDNKIWFSYEVVGTRPSKSREPIRINGFRQFVNGNYSLIVEGISASRYRQETHIKLILRSKGDKMPDANNVQGGINITESDNTEIINEIMSVLTNFNEDSFEHPSVYALSKELLEKYDIDITDDDTLIENILNNKSESELIEIRNLIENIL